MKRILLAVLALLLAVPLSRAQTTTGAVGQTNGGAINATTFNSNTDVAGFNEDALALIAVPSTSTAQATWATGTAAATGTLVITRTTMITACSGTTGITLPAIQRYQPVSILNRSGGSCLIWPSVGATVETALGTAGAVNAPFTMLTNTDIIWRPITPTAWYQ